MARAKAYETPTNSAKIQVDLSGIKKCIYNSALLIRQVHRGWSLWNDQRYHFWFLNIFGVSLRKVQFVLWQKDTLIHSMLALDSTKKSKMYIITWLPHTEQYL